MNLKFDLGIKTLKWELQFLRLVLWNVILCSVVEKY